MMKVSRNCPSGVIGRIAPSPVGASGASLVGATVLPLVGAIALPLVGAIGAVVQRLGNVDGYACGHGSVEGVTWNPAGTSSWNSGAGPRPSASPSVRRISS